MILEGVLFHNSTSNYPFDVISKNWIIIFCCSLLHVRFMSFLKAAQKSGSPKLRVCRSMMQELMMGHLTLSGSPVPSALGSPEYRRSTDPDPKSVIRESGCPKPRVCRSIMQEPMMEHLNRLGSHFSSASGSPGYRRSTDPEPISVIYSDTISETFRSVLRPPERISEPCWNVLDASWKIGQRVSMPPGRAFAPLAEPRVP